MAARSVQITDDEADVRQVVQVALRATSDWEILLAASGSEGVTLAASARPDTILLDLAMPELNGQATLAQLKAGDATRDIPVVLLTDPAAVTGAALHGLDVADFIAKPFMPFALADRLRHTLRWPG